MKAQGLLKQPRVRGALTPGTQAATQRLQSLEVRSFEIAYVHGLWHMQSSGLCGVCRWLRMQSYVIYTHFFAST
jgi:hypothetical protein